MSRSPKTDALQAEIEGGRFVSHLQIMPAFWKVFEEMRKMELALAGLREDGWVSVDERIPEVGQCVLYYEPGRIVGRTFHDGRDWVLPHKSNVTHWMPLPAKPDGG